MMPTERPKLSGQSLWFHKELQMVEYLSYAHTKVVELPQVTSCRYRGVWPFDVDLGFLLFWFDDFKVSEHLQPLFTSAENDRKAENYQVSNESLNNIAKPMPSVRDGSGRIFRLI